MGSRAASPLGIPDEFWLRDQTVSALQSRDIGALFRLLKRYAGASQTRIGTAVGLEQGYVSKVMAGRRSIIAIDVLERIADGLAMPDIGRMTLGLAPANRDQDAHLTAHVGESSSDGDDVVLRRDFLRMSLAGAGVALDARRSAGRRVGSEAPDQLRRRAARLRRLDDTLGGGDTYRAYLAECRATAALIKRGSYTEQTRRGLLSVLAEQAQQAGWAAFDAGKVAEAQTLYESSHSAAVEADDQPLAGNALAFRAYQMIEDDPINAVELAEASCRVAGADAPRGVRALLHERLARAYAATGNASKTQSALATAEGALCETDPCPQPDWVTWVDHAELQIMAGRCWTTLRRPMRAVPVLERVLTSFNDTYARDKALYLSYLAESYLVAGEIEQAAFVSGRVLDLSEGVASVRPRRRLASVIQRLGHHRSLPQVAEVLDRIDL